MCKHLRTKKTKRSVKLPEEIVNYTLTYCLDCRAQIKKGWTNAPRIRQHI